MGRDKAQLPFGQGTMLEHMLSTLREAGFDAAIAGLRPDAPAPADVPHVYDRYPGSGPLAGIEAALGSLAGEPPQPVLFVPVDLPLLPAVFLEVLWTRATQTGAWATVPYALGRPQPLCAVYCSSLAAGLGEALARKDRKVMRVVHALAPGSRCHTFSVEALAPLHGWVGTHHWFTNLNTPADWSAVHADGSRRAALRIYQGERGDSA